MKLNLRRQYTRTSLLSFRPSGSAHPDVKIWKFRRASSCGSYNQLSLGWVFPFNWNHSWRKFFEKVGPRKIPQLENCGVWRDIPLHTSLSTDLPISARTIFLEALRIDNENRKSCWPVTSAYNLNINGQLYLIVWKLNKSNLINLLSYKWYLS